MSESDYPSMPNPQEAARNECLSSNSTLFYRVFSPVFGTVFLAGFGLALFLIPEDELYLPFPAWWIRGLALLLLLGWIFFIKRTVWRLKRVDASTTHVFVTNYWHTVRYPWSEVENISESVRMGRRLIHFQLKAPGRFGQVISFLPAKHFDELLKNLNVREI